MSNALLSWIVASERSALQARSALWFNLFALALGTTLPYCSSGQSGDQWHCRIQLPVMSADDSPKPLFVLLSERFGASGFALDQELGLLVFSTEQRLTSEDLGMLATVKPYQALGAQCSARSGEVITFGTVPFPTYLETGDATTDDARYDAAKAAWISSDPEGYQHLTDPASNGK